MKALTSLLGVGFGLVSALAAQSPLTTLFTGGNGLLNGGVTFVNMTVNVPAITVNRVDINSNAAAGTFGRVRVWQTVTGVPFFSGSEGNAANWALLGEGSVIAAGNNLPSTVCFPVPFTLTSAMGGRGYAIEHIGVGPNYTNGNGTNQIYNNTEISLNAGVAAGGSPYADQVVLGGDVANPFLTALAGGGAARVFNGALHYAVGTSAPVCSFSNKVATGCGGNFASWFDMNITPNVAGPNLTGRQAVMTPGPTGYTVTTSPSAGLIPFAAHTALGGFASTIVGAVATDDGEVTVTLSQPFFYDNGAASTTALTVHTNGMVSVASNLTYLDTLGGDDWAPTTTALPNAPNTAWYSWHDMDITTAGSIKFDDNGLRAVITWDAVPSAFGVVTDVSTFQMVFDYVTSEVTMNWQSVTPVVVAPPAYSGNPWLVGYSPGGANVRPPESDVTGTGSFDLFLTIPENQHLSLTSSPRPVFGSVIDYQVNNFGTTVVPVGFLYFSAGNPFFPAGLPLSLLGVGKPGCLLNFDLANGIGPFSFVAPGLAFSLDTNVVVPSVLGLELWSQALLFDFASVDIFATLTTSNGLRQQIQAN